MSAENVATTTQDVLNTIKALDEAVDSLHWIVGADSVANCQDEACACLKRINGLVCDDASNVYRLPSVTAASMDRVGIPDRPVADVTGARRERRCVRCGIRAEDAAQQGEPICSERGLVTSHSYLDVEVGMSATGDLLDAALGEGRR